MTKARKAGALSSSELAIPLAAILMCASCASTAEDAGCNASLEFNVSARRRIPESRLILNVSARGGQLLLWGPEFGIYWFGGGDSVPEKLPISGKVIGAFAGANSIEVLATEPARTASYRATVALHEARIHSTDRIARAIFVDSTWVVLAADSAGQPYVGALGQGGLRRWSDLAVIRGDRTIDAFDISPGVAHTVFVSHKAWPYDAFVVRDGGMDVLGSARERENSWRDSAKSGSWQAMPVLLTGCGSVQMLADVSSDHRKIIVRDSSGRPLRVSDVVAPMGFVESDPQRGTITAVSSFDVREVVTYQLARKVR